MRGARLWLAVVAVAMAVAAAQETQQPDRLPVALVALSDEGGVEQPLTSAEEKNKFLFGSYSSTVYTVVSASTSTVFYSCNSGTDGDVVCSGRRKRKQLGLNRELNQKDEDLVDLQDSLGADTLNEDEEENKAVSGASDKFAFTVWTTSKTTTSITVFYTNTATTVRVSYYCVAGLMSVADFPCAG
ncbi:uncharacterized protein LOC121857013 [Homarus americanus]|nr:uncharacterized protein LOC121857013 [Homarus americanus]